MNLKNELRKMILAEMKAQQISQPKRLAREIARDYGTILKEEKGIMRNLWEHVEGELISRKLMTKKAPNYDLVEAVILELEAIGIRRN